MDNVTETPTVPAAVQPAAAPANTPEVKFSPVTVPEEQKSPELATTAPKTPLEDLDGKAAVSSPEPKADVKPVPTDNDLASKLLQETLRREDAEKKLKALTPEQQPLKAPVIGDFKTLEDYDKAMLAYGKQLGAAEAAEATERQTLQNEQLAIKTAVKGREDKARAKFTDYDATISPILPVIGSIPILRHFIGGSEMGAEVAFHLGKNPALLQELKAMSDIDLGRQLYALESRLKTATTVKQSDAPDHIKPVGNREGLKVTLGNLAEKDINGYVARRNKQEMAAVH